MKSISILPEFRTGESNVEQHKNGEILKGTNKKRRKNLKCNSGDQLCSYAKNGSECPYGTDCLYSHDTTKAVEKKIDDLPGDCYNFTVKGYCNMGVMCRFSKNHLSDVGENIIHNDVFEKYIPELNEISKDLQKILRKKSYNFDKTNHILDTYENMNHCSILVDDDEHLSKNFKRIDFKDKLILAPLTTVGNLPFRRICVEYGADITFSEMAMSQKLLEGVTGEWALVKKHPSEKNFGIQICGGKVELLTKTAQLLSENCDFDILDINCGCPIDDICYKGNGGCSMIRNESSRQRLIKSVSCISNGLNIPVTVKMRMGYGKNDKVAHELIPKLVNAGVCAVCVHGRTREQRYTRLADWDYIKLCKESMESSVPIIGNGDVMSINDYNEVKSNCDSVMIGRGALIKPWIFKEIRDGVPIDMSSNERFDMLRRYVNYGLEHWGSDFKGVETTRRFLLEWLSFLHRYVPIGLLEDASYTQKINHKPPNYRGRDDLETLMGSHCSDDWVKISEMLLGPIPDNYTFIPKHKANSYPSQISNE